MSASCVIFCSSSSTSTRCFLQPRKIVLKSAFSRGIVDEDEMRLESRGSSAGFFYLFFFASNDACRIVAIKVLFVLWQFDRSHVGVVTPLCNVLRIGEFGLMRK